MPMINHSSGFQIHGGNFYEVAGNVNLQTHQHLTIQDDQVHQPFIQPSSDAAQAFDGGPHERYGRDLTGVLRNLPNRTIVRSTPYEMASGPHRLGTSSSTIKKQEGLLPLSSLAPPSSGQHIMSPLPESAPEPTSAPITSAGVLNEPENSPYIQNRYDGPPDRLRGQTTQPIHGGTFITAENVNHSHGESGINILHRAVALEALYDSADSFPQPQCHPETRLKMLDDLYNWATTPESPRSLRWLHGPAGAGKSAIMQTLCRRLHEDSRLGGSFFFKRGHATRGNAKILFGTLAYQLALHHTPLAPVISWRVEVDPSVVGREPEVQLRKLIVEPCQLLKNPAHHILLIDGLDECEGPKIQEAIICLLRNTIRDQTYPCRLRILIASRAEPHIREKFEEPPFHSLCDSVNVEQSFLDVRRYFCDEFLRIRSEHQGTMGNIPTPWPSQHIINALVEKSSGYFIYASTVIKFVDDKHFRPTEQLELVQNFIFISISIDSDSPFQALDQLYIQILSGVPSRHRPKLCDLLCVIANLRLNPRHIEQLLDLRSGDIQLILRCLHSLLEIPVENSPDHSQISREEHDEWMGTAVSQYHAEQVRVLAPKEKRKGLRQICAEVENQFHNATRRHIELSYVTLSRLVNGGQTKSRSNALRGWLLEEEEIMVVNYALELASRGFPLDHDMLKECVDDICRARLGDKFPADGVGVNWTQRFVEKYSARFQTFWGKPMDSKRGRAVNPHTNEAYFDMVEEVLAGKRDYEFDQAFDDESGPPANFIPVPIKPENIYAVDESGFLPAGGVRRRVIGARGAPLQHQQIDGGRENTTVIVTICADKTTLHPVVIFKGKAFQVKWAQDNPLNASIAHQPKGWTDNEISVEYLKDFDEQTREKAAGATRGVGLDGHISHYSYEFVLLARRLRIQIFFYPSHGTHVYQGLDVVIFSPLKGYWTDEKNEFERTTRQKVDKTNFLKIYSRAHQRALTEENIEAAFRRRGSGQ
ncbi:DDE superfamily endonuclease-domain-containing protein [Mycena capillaripes]|nr:DDE superfamily endonuclease-domain-containing protein [Mycena capillaripes]